MTLKWYFQASHGPCYNWLISAVELISEPLIVWGTYGKLTQPGEIDSVIIVIKINSVSLVRTGT